MSWRRVINESVGVAGVFFYILCWLSSQPTAIIHYFGIALPWLALIITILLGFVFSLKDKNYFPYWGIVYVVSTVVYSICVSIWAGSIWQQVPHLATCVCFIVYFSNTIRERNFVK